MDAQNHAGGIVNAAGQAPDYRSQKHGGGLTGLGVVQRRSLNLVVCRSAVTPTRFEVLQPSYYVVMIYMPSSSNTSDFLNGFDDLVTSLAIIPGRLLIKWGNFKFHFDNALPLEISQLTNNLPRDRTHPACDWNHAPFQAQLDVVISQKEDGIVTSPVAILANTFSDHHTITGLAF